MHRCGSVVWTVVAVVLFVASARGDEAVDYVRQIKPVLRERCYACHGALKQQAKLRLDTAALAVKGGESGAAIDVANAAGSLLLARVTSHDEAERMPPEGEPLSASQIALLKSWIAQGARGPADEQAERDPRDHWAFKTPVRPVVPQVVESAAQGTVAEWSRNPIDAFLAAEHQRRGLKHQPPADKRVWLRRVSLDLIGLPPTVAELEAFVADQSPRADEAVVARLLDSPQYGERWGRHWMDIWRYSDWWGLGAEVRNSQKHIWHWREWIIESLNADKGYDQMLREMLAADELYPNDLDRLRASGFLARQYFKFNRTSWLDETIEHTSKAMLGMTFNCAKCHDHKYDPFAQTDYYRLRAIFEPYQVRTDLLPGESDFERDGLPRAFDCNLDAQTFLHVRGDDRNPDKSRVMEPAVPAFLSHAAWQVEPVSLPPEATQPGVRPFVVESYLKAADQTIVAARSALETARKKLVEAETAMKLAADKLVTEKPAEGKPADEKSIVVKDEFTTERPELWEQIGGKWSYTGGKLVQAQDGATRVALRLKPVPPENFEAKLRFKTTGGQMWKSVGINFDVVEKNEVLAYLSAYAGGPKSQIAYKNGDDNYTYPPEAAQSRKIELNQPNEMTLRVRGTLVNLLVNGELSIAYRLPLARRRGAMEIITFDATAEFFAFELKELPADVAMTDAKSGIKPTDAPQTVEQAKLAVTIAEKALVVAEAEPLAIRARADAAKARYQQPPADNAASLAQQAVKLERIAAVAKAEEAAARAELEVARAAADKKAEAEKKLTAARAAIETARQAVETPAENFTPLNGSLKTLENNLENEESRRKPFPTTSTGRRSAFAKWLTDPKHPLPARVAVNHIWLRHMGRPLVPTVFDFGRKGTLPTHPELLDWLAVELVEHGWSMKHIHRLIVTSQAYRMSSSSAGASSETIAHDPDNKFYWRANPVRMEAQLVRDSLLHLAGELDLTRGGPSIPANDETSKRRSLYFVHSHNEHQKFLSMFDDASVLDCYRRAESIVPQQALALENSPMATVMGEKIAQRIAVASPNASDNEFIRAAFLTILSVEPSSEELSLTAEGLARLTAAAKQKNRPNPEVHARTSLIQALLNHNDFVTIR
ncbi:MAG: PSD1 and planctomycete cytochrome C domain-containing protein [Planctomycetota bacterium]